MFAPKAIHLDAGGKRRIQIGGTWCLATAKVVLSSFCIVNWEVMRYVDDVLELVLKRIQMLYKFLNVGRFAELNRFYESVFELLF